MNLELAMTSELIDELMVRFDHAVFAGLKVDEAVDRQYETVTSKGNMRTCQGLATAVIIRCEHVRVQKAEPVEGDE